MPQQTRIVRKEPAAAPTAVAVLARIVADRAARAGLRISPLLKKAGLPATLMKDETARIDARSQVALLELVAGAVEDPLLGFHLARDIELREFGPLYYVMASSQKLGEAIDHASRYSSVVDESLRIVANRGVNGLSMDFEYIGIERHLDRQQMVFWLTCALKAARIFTRRELSPTYVGFIHQSDTGAAELERYFECPVHFGATADRISFDPQVVEAPILTEDPYLNHFMLTYCEEASAQRKWQENPLRTRVENAISPRLSDGSANVATIASDLGLSTRTLSRKLAAEGLTFSAILDDLRSELSNRYLQNYDLSISQIAWLLGYSEVSSFVHAFQRWTGRSPSDARRAIKTAGDARAETIV